MKRPENKREAGPEIRRPECQMTESALQVLESLCRNEPIFDASGTLKRHVLTKLEAERVERSEDDAPAKSRRDDS